MTPYTFPNPPARSLKPPLAPSIELLGAIHSGDPEAALPLHSFYAPGIEAHLRRKRPDIDVTQSALEILLEVIRQVRGSQPFTPVNLTNIVLRCTRAYLTRLPHKAILFNPPVTLALRRHAELVNSFFSRLAAPDREVIMRTYLLRQDDLTIAREMSIHPQKPKAIRAQFRRLLRTRAAGAQAQASSPEQRPVAIH